MSIRTVRTALPLVVLLVFGLSTAPIRAQQPDADGSPVATNLPDSAVTKVFVLGSPHLSNVEDQFQMSMIDSLMTALKAFAPKAIAVEPTPKAKVLTTSAGVITPPKGLPT